LTPRLKKRGVVIETEIEYRVGPYFVLAVNIISVDWRRLVKMTHRDVEIRNKKWQDENDEEAEGESRSSGVIVNFVRFALRTTKLTKFDVLAQTLAWFYYLHWVIYTPICWILYHFLIAKTFREYFLSSVADEIFYYVEEKGMEMDIGIRDASTQAAFMLSALREIRAGGQELKKKQKEGESDTKGTILGPLLGAAIKEDKAPAPPKPDGFEIPENLEYIGLELDLPVGYRRLRQAFLSSKSTFISDAVFRAEAKYDKYVIFMESRLYGPDIESLSHIFSFFLTTALRSNPGTSTTKRLASRRHRMASRKKISLERRKHLSKSRIWICLHVRLPPVEAVPLHLPSLLVLFADT
jgi:hypothetical protein